MNELTREPAVAGRFYPGTPDTLDRWVRASFSRVKERAVPCLALIGPHAGYVYSGQIAAETWARAEVPESVILLCPNHTGRGSRRAVWPHGTWRVPGGALEVDGELVRALLEGATLEADTEAHRYEHAIEVHLPLLRGRRADARIAPICLAHLSAAECAALAEQVAAVVRARGGPRRVLVAASTDMSHYVSAEQAGHLDRLALERIERLDPEGLYEVVTRREISMCGFIPTTVALAVARALGAQSAELIRYGNSGEASGDLSSVVGYAGVLVR